MKWKQLKSGELRTFAVVFDKGDEAVNELESFAREQRLSASELTGVGAFSDVVLGFFDWERKSYLRIPVDEQVEVVSLMGNVSLGEKEDRKLHLHVVISRPTGIALGGHLLVGHVRPTLEVVVTELPAHLHRHVDTETGLPLIRL